MNPRLEEAKKVCEAAQARFDELDMRCKELEADWLQCEYGPQYEELEEELWETKDLLEDTRAGLRYSRAQVIVARREDILAAILPENVVAQVVAFEGGWWFNM